MGNGATGQLPAWRRIGERGLRLDTGGTTLARYAALKSASFPEVEDIIPADGNLLIVIRRYMEVSEGLRAALGRPPGTCPASPTTLHEIPVEYGGAAGPDLAALADKAGLDTGDYINSHAAVEYTVAFLGFQPGFPYLSGLPVTLHTRRRSTPRVRVPAGSVAVGGPYTGIYPAEGPGGWHLIGRAAAVLFDPQRAAPALLQPGDRVRFVPA